MNEEELEKPLLDPRVSKVLSYLHGHISFYVSTYKENGILDHDSFMRFCRDFGIFPELCSRPMLHQIFYTMAYSNSRIIEGDHRSSFCKSPSKQGSRELRTPTSRERRNAVQSKEYIEEDQLVNALGLCALKSYALENDSDPVDKIIHLVEKISQSRGVNKIKRMSGNTRYFRGGG